MVFQFTQTMVYAIAILGLNLLTGFNGQFSLGHSAFYAVGAYTAAIMMEHMGVSYVWTLPVAGIICFVLGFLFGLPALGSTASISRSRPSRSPPPRRRS